MSQARVKIRAIAISVLVLLGIFLSMSFYDVEESRAAAIIYSNYSTGNDTTGDGSSGNPYKTFHKAYTIAASGDIIDLTGTFDWTNADEAGDAASSGYTIAKSLTIQGQSADATFIQAASTAYTANRRIFTINSSINVTIQRLTLRYGYANSDNFSGTAIASTANLTILNSIITENANPARFGGAALNYSGSGNFVMRNSTVHNNGNMTGYWRGYTAGIDGGGSGVNEITNCTFTNNQAEYNGGIYFSSGNLIVTNSTFTNNYGGVTAADIGAWASGTKAYIKNNIFADTAGGTNLYSGGSSASFVDGGYNIIESIAGNTIIANGANGNLVGNQANLNISATLAANSATNGVTTLALSAGSVAINAGDPNDTAHNGVNVPVADQRVFYRSGRTDIGSYEYGGSDSYSRPTVQSSSLTYSAVTYNQMTVSWTNGDGMRRAVFMRAANTGTASPVDNTAYTANTIFGSGTQIASSGWYTIYNGSGTSVTVTGLTRSTDYILQVFEYSGTTGVELYFTNTATDNPLAQATTAVPQPTAQATNLTFSSIAYTTMTIGWTIGNGDKRVVFIKQASSGTASPVDDTTYTASTVFGSGTQIGVTGWYCIYNSTGTSVNITGLTAQTDYIAQVFEYSGTTGIENYFADTSTDNPKLGPSATVNEPTTQATNLTFSSVAYTSMTVGWTIGNGAKRVVFAKQANSGTAEPVDNTSYTASTTFGSGTQIGATGWYCVYNSTSSSVSVSNLTLATDYIFQVFEYNDSGAIRNYNINTGTNNPKTQASASVVEPTTQATNLTFSSVAYTSMTVGWTSGNGGKRVVFAKQASSSDPALPVDNTAYTASTTFGSGTQISTTGWYCVYNSTSTSVAVTGLTASTDYIFQVIEFNESGAVRNYLTDVATNNPKLQASLAVSEPTTQATNLTFSSVAYTSMTVGWTIGNGAKRVVFAKQASSGTAEPVDNAAYTANTAFGSGTQIDATGWYCIYNSTSTSVAITGLTASMDYIFQVFEYNDSGSTRNYFTSTGTNNPKSQASATVTEPTSQASAVTFSSVSSATMTVSWTNGNGASRAVFVKQASTGTATPVDNTAYTANTVFGSGTQIGSSGWYCIYNSTGTSVAVTNLVGSTDYIAQVFEYNSTGSVYNYLSDTATDNPKVQTTTSSPTEITLGTGTSVTSASEASPINVWYRSSHSQSVYTAAEINAAGVSGPINITQVGFYINSAPNVALPSFVIKMKHVTDANVASWQTVTGMTTVYTSASYAPVAGGFQSLTLSTPFTWNGTDNIVIDTAFGMNGGCSQTGTVRYYSSSNGFRAVRSDSSDQTSTFTGGSATSSKPQIKLNFSALQYTLTYAANSNGSITGSSPQTVSRNASGSAVTAVPSTGYHFVNWSDASVQNPRTDTGVTASLSVTANFAIDSKTLTYTAGANGFLDGTTTQTVDHGSSGTAVTATPNANFHFVGWSDDSVQNPRTDENVTQDISVSAIFAIDTHTLRYYAVAPGPGSGTAKGSIIGLSTQSIDHGSSGSSVTAVPNTGYRFVNWSDDSIDNPRTDENVLTNLSITANFAINIFDLTYSAGSGGVVSGSLAQSVEYGASGTVVMAEPSAGFHFVNWSDGSILNPRTDASVSTNISVSAVFAINTYTIRYSAGLGGSISGSSLQSVDHGARGVVVTAVPLDGYIFYSWSDGATSADRAELGVTGNVVLTASFVQIPRIPEVSQDGTYSTTIQQPAATTLERYIQIPSSAPTVPDSASSNDSGNSANDTVLLNQETEYVAQVYESDGKVILSEVRVRIVDENGNPIPDLLVTIHSDPKQGRTDKNGVVVFNDMPTGYHKITFDYKSSTVEKDVKIDEPTVKNQEVKLELINIEVKNSKPVSWIYIILAVVSIVVGYFIVRRARIQVDPLRKFFAKRKN